jgi:hypothetical protein
MNDLYHDSTKTSVLGVRAMSHRRVTHILAKMANKMPTLKKDALVAAIGDEDTCTGLLLGGIGDKNKSGHTNFLVCNNGGLAPSLPSLLRPSLFLRHCPESPSSHTTGMHPWLLQ